MAKGLGESLGDIKLGKKKFPVLLILIIGVGGIAILLGSKKSSSDSTDTNALEDKIMSDVNGILAAQNQSNSNQYNDLLASINNGFNSIVKLLPPQVTVVGGSGVTLPPSSTPNSTPSTGTPPTSALTFDALNNYLKKAGAGYQVNDLQPGGVYPAVKANVPLEGLSPNVYLTPPSNFYSQPKSGQIWFTPDGVVGHESLINEGQKPANTVLIGTKRLGDGATVNVYGLQPAAFTTPPAFSAQDYWESKGVVFG